MTAIIVPVSKKWFTPEAIRDHNVRRWSVVGGIARCNECAPDDPRKPAWWCCRWPRAWYPAIYRVNDRAYLDAEMTPWVVITSSAALLIPGPCTESLIFCNFRIKHVPRAYSMLTGRVLTSRI